MKIIVLGSGCPTCKKLEEATIKAVAELDIPASVIKEEDFSAMMSYGVMRTPALVINDKLVLSGRLPSEKELKELIRNHSAE